MYDLFPTPLGKLQRSLDILHSKNQYPTRLSSESRYLFSCHNTHRSACAFHVSHLRSVGTHFAKPTETSLAIIAPTSDPSWNDKSFSEHVRRVRQEIIQDRDKLPYFVSSKRADFIPGGCEIWYGDPPYYLKLIGAPGTLAGDIMRIKADLPRYNCDPEIIGNDVREVERKSMPYDEGRVDLTSRIAARKLPNYPSSHSTPKSISRNPQHTSKRFTIYYSAAVLPASYSYWEGRKMGLSFFPKFKRSFLDDCPVQQGRREDPKHQAMDDRYY